MEETKELQKPVLITEILKRLDDGCPKEGTKPSEVWEYRQVVMQKYGLPQSHYKWTNPRRYIAEIEEIAKENGVKIRSRHEFERFFIEHPKAKALYDGKRFFREPTIVTSPPKNLPEWYQLRAKAKQLSHEIVHALQDKHYPRMPVEEQEREAYYYQQLDESFFRQFQDDPDYIHYVINTVVENAIKMAVSVDNKLDGKKVDKQNP